MMKSHASPSSSSCQRGPDYRLEHQGCLYDDEKTVQSKIDERRPRKDLTNTLNYLISISAIINNKKNDERISIITENPE